MYELNPDIVSKQLDDGKSVLVDGKTRKFFAINETGSVIWNGLKEDKSPDEITLLLTIDFAIEREEARAHVDEFIDRLISDGILTTK